MESEKSELVSLSWESMNAYIPEDRKGLFSCMKTKVEVERRHIIQDGE